MSQGIPGKQNPRQYKGSMKKSYSAAKPLKYIQQNEIRPGLQMLNNLSNKIAEQNKTSLYRKEIKLLHQQNKELKQINLQLEKQLQIQKRLRKVWNQENIVSFEDMESLKQDLAKLKQKYARFK